MLYFEMTQSLYLVMRDKCVMFTMLCVKYRHAFVGRRVTLGHSSKGWREPYVHHKSLLSLVSNISSKQRCYECQVPHLCL